MDLYVTRHGQTDWNIRRLAQGKTDIPLNEKGVAQAHALAERLGGRGIDVVVCSPLQRAAQTAEIIATHLGVPVETDARLAEQDFGSYEGRDYNDETLEHERRSFACRVGGGESTLDVAARVYAFLEGLPARHPGQTVLVVAHGALCRVLDTYFHNFTNEAFYAWRMGNCEVRHYKI